MRKIQPTDICVAAGTTENIFKSKQEKANIFKILKLEQVRKSVLCPPNIESLMCLGPQSQSCSAVHWQVVGASATTNTIPQVRNTLPHS